MGTSVAIQGLLTVLSPASILAIFAGVIIGIIVGIIPGLGATIGLSLLLPVVFKAPPAIGLMLLVSLWAANGYGGSISSILINVPGHSGAVATCFDGYPMAKQGKAGEAIGLAMGASFFGTVIGTFFLMLVAPPLAKLAVKIGPAQYTVIGILCLNLLGGLSGKSTIKGLISSSVGIMASFIGYDLITGYVRFNFGSAYLFNGISFTVALIGFFAIAELMITAEKGGSIAEFGELGGSVIGGLKEVLKRPLSFIRGTIVGLITGVLPGLGITIACLLGYDVEKRASKHPELFGTGVPEGIIGPESANNSCQPASLIPLLTLGIPAGTTSAVFLGALLMYGIMPGAAIFTKQGDIVWAIMWGVIVSSFAFLIVGILFANHLAKVTLIPTEYLIPCTVLICFVAAFTAHYSFYDILAVFACGVVGFAFKLFDYPIAPAVIGLILGPIIENSFFKALIISDGSYKIFFGDPITISLWCLFVVVLIYPLVSKKLTQKRVG